MREYRNTLCEVDWVRVFIGTLILLGIILSPVVERIIVALLYLDWLSGKSGASNSRHFFSK